jgi:hypothetical protein
MNNDMTYVATLLLGSYRPASKHVIGMLIVDDDFLKMIKA